MTGNASTPGFPIVATMAVLAIWATHAVAVGTVALAAKRAAQTMMAASAPAMIRAASSAVMDRLFLSVMLVVPMELLEIQALVDAAHLMGLRQQLLFVRLDRD